MIAWLLIVTMYSHRPQTVVLTVDNIVSERECLNLGATVKNDWHEQEKLRKITVRCTPVRKVRA